ncbi:hypothetical protein ACF3NA_02625 [Alkanindiges sp. WGS2144]|uniref:hypothetical protein n=1 Tax=Alkanindiges sp. WGS2144 TaxID=3366808 RepID=UPI003753764A
MKIPILVGIAMLGSLAVTGAQAAPMGEAFQYNTAKLQQACRGKSQGAPASVAMNGVVFNGTCEYRFIPAKTMRDIDAMEADQACSGQAASTTATLNGAQVNGKCALAFKNIGPNNMSGTGGMTGTANQ